MTLLPWSPAPAQDSPTVSVTYLAAAVQPQGVTDSSATQRFDVPARALGDALAEYSRQAGVNLVMQSERLPDIRIAALAGRFTREEALRRLLDGTGLSARFVDPRTAVISGDRAAASGRTGAHALSTVVVKGNASRPKSYSVRRTSSATRTDTPLLDTPQSVTVVTSELISDQSMQSLSDVVRYVPGVTMGTGEGHRDQPTIRGNNTTADFFVDGVRDDAQFFRDLYNVDRVEVLKGPNAMIFGRGGGGGVINRVLKAAEWAPTRDFRVEGGAHGHRRASIDLGQGAGRTAALRLNAMAEHSGTFRDATDIERRAVNPGATIAFGARTTVRAGFEHLHDERTVDRGIPSFEGVPFSGAITSFFGDPSINRSRAVNQVASVALEHAARSRAVLRSRLQLADYDKMYRNVVPGSLNAAGTEVTFTSYSDAMRRRNAVAQTDMAFAAATGAIHHSLVIGTELTRQRTDRLRQTGFFNDVATSVTASSNAPVISVPLTFRAGANDPETRSLASVAAAYAQDQLTIGSHVQLLVGLRHDRFSVRSVNHRNGEELRRVDNLLSPRAGVVLKPIATLSIYGSHSISHLPSAGDQFTQLTLATQDLEPERFTNRELGVKWEPVQSLALSAAVYRLDRTNSAAPDPADPTRIVQTGSQRSSGFELGASGSITPAWQVMAGYAAQRARVTSSTAAASAGAVVPLVPERTVTLWNRFQLNSVVGAGAGVVHQSEVFAGIDNKVRLPAFTRTDAALYLQLSRHVGLQANVENVLDERYYPAAHSNNNIMPGAPRTLRLSMNTAF